MSAEGLRDMKTMLAQLEADGPFDHTETGLFSNKDPNGFLGTDFLGYAWRDQRIKQLEEELEQEKNEHQGTKAETDRLRKKVADELTRLKITTGQEYAKLEAAYHTFQREIGKDILQLQKQTSSI
jgi:hypothetical protein